MDFLSQYFLSQFLSGSSFDDGCGWSGYSWRLDEPHWRFTLTGAAEYNPIRYGLHMVLVYDDEKG